MSNSIHNESGIGPQKIRSLSAAGFLSISENALAASFREHIKALNDSYPVDNVVERNNFSEEVRSFHSLFIRHLKDRRCQKQLRWNKVKTPEEGIINYSDVPEPTKDMVSALLNKLVVIKLNGGLGTSMGCVGPKSLIEVKDGMKFIDLTIRQIEYLNEHLNANVPLILMNSFNTDEETNNMIKKYVDKGVDIRCFMQSKYPRINMETLLPIADNYNSPKEYWYPPGHGDMYMSLKKSGLLDELLASGKEYIFVSNADNLGATVDFKLLNYLETSKCEFLMEVTKKTKADIKGGTLMEYENRLELLEIAQVPENYLDEFKSLKKFTIFNTNNIWISLNAVKNLTKFEELELDVISNIKELHDGTKILQLETAVGAAIKYFKSACGVVVPRTRFLPVKTTNDLFLITSDLYSVEHGNLMLNPNRVFSSLPVIKLGEHFKKVSQFNERLRNIPHILDLDTLIISGSVYFGKNVTLSGTVVIISPQGQRIDIPPGSVLNDKVVLGNLTIMDHI